MTNEIFCWIDEVGWETNKAMIAESLGVRVIGRGEPQGMGQDRGSGRAKGFEE